MTQLKTPLIFADLAESFIRRDAINWTVRPWGCLISRNKINHNDFWDNLTNNAAALHTNSHPGCPIHLPLCRVYALFGEVTVLFCEVTTQFCDVANQFCNVTMPSCQVSLPLCRVTMQFYDITIQFCDVTTQFCYVTIQFCDVTIQFCGVTTQFCYVTIQFCDVTMQFQKKTGNIAVDWRYFRLPLLTTCAKPMLRLYFSVFCPCRNRRLGGRLCIPE